jgi:hypothetical protein
MLGQTAEASLPSCSAPGTGGCRRSCARTEVTFVDGGLSIAAARNVLRAAILAIR